MYGNLTPIVEPVTELGRDYPAILGGLSTFGDDLGHFGHDRTQEIMILGDQHHLAHAGQPLHQRPHLGFRGPQCLGQIAHPGRTKAIAIRQQGKRLFPQQLVGGRQAHLMGGQAQPRPVLSHGAVGHRRLDQACDQIDRQLGTERRTQPWHLQSRLVGIGFMIGAKNAQQTLIEFGPGLA
nr:hypothetical protein [Magnetospirillum moscoviense]